MPKQSNIVFKGELGQVDIAHKVAYGWAYVCKKGDKIVVDHSGQIWPIEEVEKTAHQFVADCRVGGESHITKGGAELVESIVFSKALQDALGIDIKNEEGESIEGWFIGMKITDSELLQKVQNKDLPMFSIGGTANIEEIEEVE